MPDVNSPDCYRLSTLIFDVDGTLAETEDSHRKAFNLAFQKTGLGWNWDHDLYCKLLGVTGGKERIRYYATEFDQDFLASTDINQRILSLHQMKTDYYSELISSGETALRPGILRLIEEARENNLRLAISTTTTRINVLNLLSATLGKKGPEIFDAISASDSAERKKPAPDVYYDVLGKLGCEAAECFAFEDSQSGLISARAAGIEAVVTLSAFTSCRDHMDARAVLSNLGEPNHPCDVHRGEMFGRDFVDLELLHEWQKQRNITQ